MQTFLNRSFKTALQGRRLDPLTAEL